MNVGVIHLTDIHITEKTNLEVKIAPLCKAILQEFKGYNVIFIVISGDIAYSGKKEEYEKAKAFLSVMKQLITGESKNTELKYIFVPGNHDCDFANKDSQLRKNSITNVNYGALGSDGTVTELCLAVQQEFWNFYSVFRPVPSDRLYYQIVEQIEGYRVAFSCVNSAWMSQLNEVPGSLFFPVKKYEEANSNLEVDVNFAVWHHPYNWFNPNTAENNKKEFEKFTETIASTHFLGHEHEHSSYFTENRTTGDKINLVSGKLLNDDKKKNDSGFNTLAVNLKDRTGILKAFNWDKTAYVSEESQVLDLSRDLKHDFPVNDEFFKELEQINIPLVIDNRPSIKLSDIFVYPDLENFNAETSLFDGYLNSSKLLEPDYGNCVVDGESQIGKSSLLAILYIRAYEKRNYPLLLKGKDFKDLNFEKTLRKAFRTQYLSDYNSFDKYMQLDNSKKVLLIDDFQDCQLNNASVKKLFDLAITKFSKVIIVMDAANSILPSMRTEFHDVEFYSIKPFGYKKRNELVEKYQYLKENPNTLNEQKYLDTVKTLFDNVQSILGEKLMPAYPIYVLSILQALEYKPLKQNETSFGYCYQTLLHYSLHKAGVANDDMDSYFNFLTELAYVSIKSKNEYFTRTELSEFFIKYEKRFIVPSYDNVLKVLKKSKIIQETDEGFKFGYDYILYYLSAKKISDIIHTKEGKEIVLDLFQDLHVERNANILVFITHHSKDISFIEQSLLSSMIILDEVNPISLEKNDPFYNELLEFAEELKNDILEINRNPKTERDNLLVEKDENLRVTSSNSKLEAADHKEIVDSTLPFRRSFRSIEIVGQIIKNRKGSLERSQLLEMISELYTTGFRTIGYISDLLLLAKDDIIDLVNKELGNRGDVYEIEKRINRFVQLTSFEACLGVFSKLMQAVGHKDLRSLYLDVANQINTPAAKLVSFGINSYYGTISIDELKKLVEELKGNIVALKMLRARVKSYVYNRNLDYRTKQQFASILNMEISSVNPNKAVEYRS